MKKIILILTLLCFMIPSYAMALEVPSETICVMSSDGRVIYAKNPHKKRLLASITKIMTAILAIESGKMDNVVTVGNEINSSSGTSIYLELGEEMLLSDLVYGLLMRSGNDAALSIAREVSGDVAKFADLMNLKANELGMKNTHFSNPHGLNEVDENLSTAYDMALLTKYATKNETFREIWSTKNHTVKTNKKTYNWENKNKLLKSYKYATGGKNGYTEKARRTLVTTAKKDDLEVIVVTLNDSDDYNTHEKMHEYVFANYKNYQILNYKKFELFEDTFYNGNLYIKDNFAYALKENEKDLIKVTAKLEKISNYQNNDKVGTIEVTLDNQVIHQEDVYIDIPNKTENWWTRIWKWLFK